MKYLYVARKILEAGLAQVGKSLELQACSATWAERRQPEQVPQLCCRGSLSTCIDGNVSMYWALAAEALSDPDRENQGCKYKSCKECRCKRSMVQ